MGWTWLWWRRLFIRPDRRPGGLMRLKIPAIWNAQKISHTGIEVKMMNTRKNMRKDRKSRKASRKDRKERKSRKNEPMMRKSRKMNRKSRKNYRKSRKMNRKH
jgi:hypothetical protein